MLVRDLYDKLSDYDPEDKLVVTLDKDDFNITTVTSDGVNIVMLVVEDD
jgi:hypothetical protein